MTNVLDKFLSETTNDVAKDLAWLINHDFDLDEEQYYGYGLEKTIKAGVNTITIGVDYWFKESEWTVHIKLNDEKNIVAYFKFADGTDHIKAKRVIDALEIALGEFDKVTRLDKVIERLRAEDEAKFKAAREKLNK